MRFGSFFVKMLSYPVCILQTGRVQAYAFFVVVGVLAFFGYYVVRVTIWTSTYSASFYSRRWPGLRSCCFIPGEKQEPDPGLGEPGGLCRVSGFAAAGLALPDGRPGFQFEERADWIPSLGAHYHIGIDGISLLLVMLTTLMGFIAMLCSWNAIQDRVKEYYAMFLLLQTGMIGVFLSLDFFLFYVFWELVLVPMYFIIGVWGGPRKLYAAIKFFLYTLAGSVLMLLGILTLYFQHFQPVRLLHVSKSPS